MVVLSELLDGSSSSTSTYDHKYDVFLSFRGGDTRLNFTDHLYSALVNVGITTFLDDEEIDTGQDLKPELENAIKASRASIIVLSKDYASSTWCLDEMVLILEQHRNFNHIVYPIFYHVEPTDVRKQQNSFGIAMAKHKQRMETETNEEKRNQLAQKIELWNKALTITADLKGKDAKGRQETKFIEEIVRDIYRILGAPLRSTDLPHLFGMEYSVRCITSWVKDGSLHTADILTISGLGGIGKTFLARHVHELNRGLFDRSSFIEGVSEKCAEQVNGLLDLQKQLCGDISKTSLIQICDVFKYTSMIENALASQKVFIVLDDIDSLKQLDALLGKKGFHPGSKIIITTKDASLTEKYAPITSIVQPKHTHHSLVGLDEEASLQLLSYHAFKGNGPKEGYKEVSIKLMEYCHGHPLALKVLGESLHSRDVVEWEERIEGLKEEPDSRVQRALQMSFDSMPSNHDKELFKHIACFFVGKDRKYTETILKACGIRTVVHGITNLIDRCLLMIGPKNELKMHQLLQEMGRDVVRQESPDKPWKRSRLWCHEESFNALEQNKGTGKLKGLVLDMRMLEKDKLHGSVELKTDALSKMDNLMLLQLNYVQLNGPFKNFPKKLRWLCMHGLPLKSLPSDLPIENLVALDMSYSNLESFGMSYSNLQQPENGQKLSGSISKETRRLRSLKILNLSFCKQLRSVGFFELPALERLIVVNCVRLNEVCESIEQCDQLVLIDLSYCVEFRKLLRIIGKLKKVETLLLEGCNLGEFPAKMRDMDLFEMPKSNNIGINPQTSSYSIVEAIPRDFRSFVISFPSSLVCLSLKYNNLSNESFSTDFGSLSMLKELYLDGNSIVSLPNCVRNLLRLEKLSIEECPKLKTVEYPPRTLKHLIFDCFHSIQKIVFDREMSPLTFGKDSCFLPYLEVSVDGIIKCDAMTNIPEEVLCSLGWTNLEFTENQQVETLHLKKKRRKLEVQMIYEFGIFSTIYEGIKMPNWINHRCKGSSISFTMPSSSKQFRGLNFCHVLWNPHPNYLVQSTIRITNITKNRTWIYTSCNHTDKSAAECVIFLSHWMFDEIEMEDGDQVTITHLIYEDEVGAIRECGVNLVFDDGNMEKDPLEYYKSWNHIIGGDLSAFQTTTGEYLLDFRRFFSGRLFRGDIPNGEILPTFTAFSQRKANIVGGTPEDHICQARCMNGTD